MRTDHLTESDTALLARLDAEPDKAMEALVEQYTALVCHVASKYLADPEDVKECVNDVFTEVYLHRAEFSQEKGSLASWIGTIARNRAISRYRKQRKDQPLPEGGTESEQSGPDTTAELEQAMDVEQAISQLSGTDQQIIRMKYYGGMSISEIAETLHICSNVFYGVYDCTFYGYPDSTFQQYVDAMPKTYQKQVTDSNTYTVKWVDTPTNNSFQNLSAASDAKPAAPAFTDVAASAYYSTPVQWAVGKGITTGTTASTFSPNNTCTRAQIITFLYRAAGSPEPKGSGAFSDVAATAYYAKAAQWAAEQGMASGSTFAPNAPCTRMMAVEFMWKQAGSPDADAAAFTDASSPAVDWAVSAGVTTGVTASTFAPDNTCTRAQIVTFLYRAFAD